jgi:hypothetical protein
MNNKFEWCVLGMILVISIRIDQISKRVFELQEFQIRQLVKEAQEVHNALESS